MCRRSGKGRTAVRPYLERGFGPLSSGRRGGGAVKRHQGLEVGVAGPAVAGGAACAAIGATAHVEARAADAGEAALGVAINAVGAIERMTALAVGAAAVVVVNADVVFAPADVVRVGRLLQMLGVAAKAVAARVVDDFAERDVADEDLKEEAMDQPDLAAKLDAAVAFAVAGAGPGPAAVGVEAATGHEEIELAGGEGQKDGVVANSEHEKLLKEGCRLQAAGYKKTTEQAKYRRARWIGASLRLETGARTYN